MIFGELPVADAEGAILAHSVKHPAGLFKKGRVLSAKMWPRLRHPVSLRFSQRSSAPTMCRRTRPQPPSPASSARQAPPRRHPLPAAPIFMRRCRGLAIIDTERVRALNRLHESLTLATVQPFAIVEEREMVATVKVIPFAVPRDVLERALEIIGAEPLIRVAAFRAKRAGLIITSLPQTKPSIIAKSEAAMRERIAALDGTLA